MSLVEAAHCASTLAADECGTAVAAGQQGSNFIKQMCRMWTQRKTDSLCKDGSCLAIDMHVPDGTSALCSALCALMVVNSSSDAAVCVKQQPSSEYASAFSISLVVNSTLAERSGYWDIQNVL